MGRPADHQTKRKSARETIVLLLNFGSRAAIGSMQYCDAVAFNRYMLLLNENFYSQGKANRCMLDTIGCQTNVILSFGGLAAKPLI